MPKEGGWFFWPQIGSLSALPTQLSWISSNPLLTQFLCSLPLSRFSNFKSPPNYSIFPFYMVLNMVNGKKNEKGFLIIYNCPS